MGTSSRAGAAGDEGADAAADSGDVRTGGQKPPGVSWESWIERQIREGMDRGEFDHLPGAGKPIADLDRPHDEDRWIREKLKREEVSYLPPTLAVRKELDDTLEQIAAATSEAEVRRLIAAINERIVEVNRTTVTGPPSTVARLDVERTLEAWRAGTLS